MSSVAEIQLFVPQYPSDKTMKINHVWFGGSSKKGMVLFGWKIRKDWGEVAFELHLEEKSRTQQGQGGRDRKGGPSGNQNGAQIKARRQETARHRFCAYPRMPWPSVRLEDEPGKTQETIAQEVGFEGLPFQLSTLGQSHSRLKISPLETYFLG